MEEKFNAPVPTQADFNSANHTLDVWLKEKGPVQWIPSSVVVIESGLWNGLRGADLTECGIEAICVVTGRAVRYDREGDENSLLTDRKEVPPKRGLREHYREFYSYEPGYWEELFSQSLLSAWSRLQRGPRHQFRR